MRYQNWTPLSLRIVAKLMQSCPNLSWSALQWASLANSVTGFSFALASMPTRIKILWRLGRLTRKLFSNLSPKMERLVLSTCCKLLFSSSWREMLIYWSTLPPLWSCWSVTRMFSQRNSLSIGSTKRASSIKRVPCMIAKLRRRSAAKLKTSFNTYSK